jgi:hypothetical protein
LSTIFKHPAVYLNSNIFIQSPAPLVQLVLQQVTGAFLLNACLRKPIIKAAVGERR